MVDVLALDLGASSGRVVVGRLNDEHLSLTETHRFPNEMIHIHNRIYWDILRLFHELKQGLLTTYLQGYKEPCSLGIDTWAVDFGLLDARGELLGNPYHYRDGATEGAMEKVLQLVPRSEIFTRTGIQFLPFNTIYQLFVMREARSPLLEKAECLLLIPELLRYFLTGERYSEWTVASTSQLCNPYTHDWDRELLARLGLPSHLFLKPVEPGTPAGSIHPRICDELGIPSIPVIAVAEHDTASAVVAIPTLERDFAYLSCGTWSLLGTELAQPIINEQALAENVTNEGGVNGTTRLLKNIAGLWLLQQCRANWRSEGVQLSYQEEVELMEQAQPLRSFIDPDHPTFALPTHIVERIQRYCEETRQPIPTTRGEILRCILESLAMRHRNVLERIERLVGKRFNGLHIVGGGAANRLLCQWTADALGRHAWAGPQEGTALGNILTQLITLGEVRDLVHARALVRHSFPIQTYEPQNLTTWEEAYQRFLTVTKE